jgi:putative ABC transport system permease protein
MLGVTPLAGRDFDERDGESDTVAAVINQRLAATLWPGQPPIGRTLRLASHAKPLTIAGVAPNGWYSGHRRQADPNFVFVSANHAPTEPGEVTLYVRYAGLLEDVVPAVSRTLRAVDDRAPIVYIRTMTEQLASLTWPIQALTILLVLFAGGSLLIATIGQYAAMAFTMRRRIRELGVRIALGASSRNIVSAVVRESLRLTALGLAIGCALGLAMASGLQSILFGITPTDGPTYLAVVALLGAASLVACYAPAHRAARMDPMQALRDE